MTAQEELEAACQAIRENAEANCRVCREISYWRANNNAHYLAITERDMADQHTCHATIEAAKRGMKAAVRELCRTGQVWDGFEEQMIATINRLLKGEGNGR